MRRRQISGASPRDTFTEWWWAPSPTIFRTIPAGFATFEHVILPEVDPGDGAHFFFVHEFKFVGGDEASMGLQTASELGAGTRSAVFSIRNAVSADIGAAGSAMADGSGWSCQVPYPWEAGTPYGMRVWSEEPSWWSAAVRDQTSGTDLLIGRIRVPDDWRRLASWSVTATRYGGGTLARCADVPECQVAYREPTADEGAVKPVRHENDFGPGTCETSRIVDVRGGVRHGMGGPG